MMDIYGDLDDFDMGETINELKEKNNELTDKVNELVIQLETTVKNLAQVKAENMILTQNISKLYNTAKADYDRRTKMISELRKQVDDLLFKRNQGQNFKIPKRKIEDEDNNKPESKKRKVEKQNVVQNQKPIQQDKNKENMIKNVSRNDDRNHENNRRERNYENNRREKYKESDKRNRRSRSRSRERKSDRSRSEREKDRNRKRQNSPDFRKQKQDDNFEDERKSVLEMINRKKQNRNQNDSDCISIDSKSSNESPTRKKQNDRSKTTRKENRDKNDDIYIFDGRSKENKDRRDRRSKQNSPKSKRHQEKNFENSEFLVKSSKEEQEKKIQIQEKDVTLPLNLESQIEIKNLESNKFLDIKDTNSNIESQIETKNEECKTFEIKSDELEEGEITDDDIEVTKANQTKEFKHSPHEKKKYNDFNESKSPTKRIEDRKNFNKGPETLKKSVEPESVRYKKIEVFEKDRRNNSKKNSKNTSSDLPIYQKEDEYKSKAFVKPECSVDKVVETKESRDIKCESIVKNYNIDNDEHIKFLSSKPKESSNGQESDKKHTDIKKVTPKTLETRTMDSNLSETFVVPVTTIVNDRLESFRKCPTNKQEQTCKSIVKTEKMNHLFEAKPVSIVKTEVLSSSSANSSGVIENSGILTVNSSGSLDTNGLGSSNKNEVKNEVINEKENLGQNVTQMVTPMVKPKPKRPRCRLLP